MTSLTGIHVPLITPFAADGTVAADVLADLANQVIDDGVAGLVALGTTAEADTLDSAERVTVVDVCARVARARGVRLTVGTAGSVAALRAMTRWPEVSAALVTVPAFSRPGEAGVLAHFTHLAEHSPLPTPGTRVISVAPATLAPAWPGCRRRCSPSRTRP